MTSRFAKSVCATDYMDPVIELLAENMGTYADPKCQCRTAKFDWGNTRYMELVDHRTRTQVEPEMLHDVELVIGSDIVYWETSVEPLFCALTVY